MAQAALPRLVARAQIGEQIVDDGLLFHNDAVPSHRDRKAWVPWCLASFAGQPLDPQETSPASGRVFERKATIAYALVENADLYQRIMRIYENKRVLGPRLTENDVAARLWQQFAFELVVLTR